MLLHWTGQQLSIYQSFRCGLEAGERYCAYSFQPVISYGRANDATLTPVAVLGITELHLGDALTATAQ